MGPKQRVRTSMCYTLLLGWEDRLIYKLSRWWHRAYALTHGFFWLPCPICREPFGGHEWVDYGLGLDSALYHMNTYPYQSMFEATGVCRKCASEATRRNKLFLAQAKEHVPYGT